MYETGLSGEMTDPELLKGLAVATVPIAVAIAAKREAAQEGLSKPLSLALGLGSGVAAFVIGRHFTSDLQSLEPSEQYPPNRHLDI